MKDFFISYSHADRPWAEWIAWTLEEAGYSVIIQAWDFRPGGNFVLDMHQAAQDTRATLAVLSDNYLKAGFTQPEWAVAFARDPQGQQRSLIPIRVTDCQPLGLLSTIIYIDLADQPGPEARKILLDGLQEERFKPGQAPPYPVRIAERVAPNRVLFPGILWTVPYERNRFLRGVIKF